VLHADETPIQVLRPETGTKPHRTYLWAYAPSAFDTLKAVVYDFTPGRSGEHARAFLGKWRGKLLMDDYVGDRKVLAAAGVTEICCWAHARRKFYDLHAACGSPVAEQALACIGELYAIERDGKAGCRGRCRVRQQRAKPLLEKLLVWMQVQRARCAKAAVPTNDACTKGGAGECGKGRRPAGFGNERGASRARAEQGGIARRQAVVGGTALKNRNSSMRFRRRQSARNEKGLTRFST